MTEQPEHAPRWAAVVDTIGADIAAIAELRRQGVALPVAHGDIYLPSDCVRSESKHLPGLVVYAFMSDATGETR